MIFFIKAAVCSGPFGRRESEKLALPYIKDDSKFITLLLNSALFLKCSHIYTYFQHMKLSNSSWRHVFLINLIVKRAEVVHSLIFSIEAEPSPNMHRALCTIFLWNLQVAL